MSIDISVVIPTFNERDNIDPIIDSVNIALVDVNWEIIFVDDDSPDGTADYIKEISRKNDRIRCLRRVNKRGLTSAAMEGMLSSSATCVALMDADLQHDESLLNQMYEIIIQDKADIVIGSRYMEGGSTGAGLNKIRLFISKFATTIGKSVLKVDITDPMSGFFMLRRDVFEHQMRKLSGKGFKILLDLLASANIDKKVLELPYEMRQRSSGQSKLDAMVAAEYYQLLLEKLIGNVIPVRFLMFVSVGLTGILVHLSTLAFLHKVMELDFVISQLIGTLVAMTSNFIINNSFTYRDMRLSGKGFLIGLASFYLACSIGAFVNIMLSEFLFSTGVNWLIAGVTGAFFGAVWNYSITATFTWKKRRQS